MFSMSLGTMLRRAMSRTVEGLEARKEEVGGLYGFDMYYRRTLRSVSHLCRRCLCMMHARPPCLALLSASCVRASHIPPLTSFPSPRTLDQGRTTCFSQTTETSLKQSPTVLSYIKSPCSKIIPLACVYRLSCRCSATRGGSQVYHLTIDETILHREGFAKPSIVALWRGNEGQRHRGVVMEGSEGRIHLSRLT
jgi:hypothetical protein